MDSHNHSKDDEKKPGEDSYDGSALSTRFSEDEVKPTLKIQSEEINSENIPEKNQFPVNSEANKPNIQQNLTYNNSDSLNKNNSYKYLSSMDFAEQIRRLEEEGNKLRASTISTLSILNPISFGVEGNGGNLELNKSYPSLSQSLPLPTHISTDRKTISELRIQLENQRKETERLQKQLVGDSLRIASSVVGNNSNNNISQASNKTGSFSTVCGDNVFGVNGSYASLTGNPDFPPISTSQPKPAFSAVTTRDVLPKMHEYQPPSHLERSLKESQEQIMDLRKKLIEANELSELQKRQFRKNTEDLKGKLHDIILNRDTILDLRQKEAKGQDELIDKLQAMQDDLQDQCQRQAEALVTANSQLEDLSQKVYVNDSALNKIQSLVRQRRNRQSLTQVETSSRQSVENLVQTVETCLQDLDHEISTKTFKLNEIESYYEELKRSKTEKEFSLVQDFKSKMEVLSRDHENNMSEALDKASTSRQQVNALQAKLLEIENEHQTKLKLKENELYDLQLKLEDAEAEVLNERARLQEKRVALESSLDQVQKELVENKDEKNELIGRNAALEAKIQDLKNLTTQLERDLEIEQDKYAQQRHREEELRTQILNMEAKLTEKETSNQRLERMVEVVKEQCSAQVVDKVATTERIERERYIDQIKSVSSQLATMTEKCNRATVEQQMTITEMESVKGQVAELKDKLEKSRSELESALTERNALTTVLGSQRTDVEKLRQDKEQFYCMSEQRAEELASLKTTLEKTVLQLEEKERVLSTFREQSSSINQLMEINVKASDSAREEKEKVISDLQDKIASLEEVKPKYDSLLKKLETKSKKVKELERESLKANEELSVKSQELDVLEQEKASVIKELQESRVQVAGITTSRDNLRRELSRVKMIRNKELNKLQIKLKESEQGYKLSQKALKSKDLVDHKAVRLADKIQKEMTDKRSELDHQMSRIHTLEEKLETMQREKSMVEKDKDSLKKSLSKSLVHTQELNDELLASQAHNQELTNKVSQLEQDIEKANLKLSSAQAQVERSEQDIATIRLKRHLDIKECKRIQHLKGGSTISSTESTVKDGQSVGKVASEGEASSEPGDSEAPTIRQNYQTESTEVGKELKNLLLEMKKLISDQRDAALAYSTDEPEQTEPTRLPSTRTYPSRLDDRNQYELNYNTSFDADKSWATKSLKDFRGKLNPNITDMDKSHNLSRFSQNGKTDSRSGNEHHTSAYGVSKKFEVSNMTLLPDTQELCRRLEEKIDSLTRMGGNLQKDNQEMANLISRQGEKLDSVKDKERRTRQRKN